MDEFEDGKGEGNPESCGRGGSGGGGREEEEGDGNGGGSGAVMSSPQRLMLQSDDGDVESVVSWTAMSLIPSEVLAKRLSFQ